MFIEGGVKIRKSAAAAAPAPDEIVFVWIYSLYSVSSHTTSYISHVYTLT